MHWHPCPAYFSQMMPSNYLILALFLTEYGVEPDLEAQTVSKYQ